MHGVNRRECTHREPTSISPPGRRAPCRGGRRVRRGHAVRPGVAPASADPIRDGEYQLRALDAASAWRYSTGAGVTVAVLDSGVDGAHPDLAGQVLPGRISSTAPPTGGATSVGHGTTVAALIAGRSDKDTGVARAGAGRPDPAGARARRAEQVRRRDDRREWTALGGRPRRPRGQHLAGRRRAQRHLFDALTYAQAHDVVVIACTGNVVSAGESGEVWYPAREAGVVAVAGLNDAQTTTPGGRRSARRPAAVRAARPTRCGPVR